MSKLLPLSIIKNIPNLYETENKEEKLCYVKLFLADSSWTWYIIEMAKKLVYSGFLEVVKIGNKIHILQKI
ncbi:hypothetical protein [Aliarcobacter butzleri]|uniref:hypothetical protein n=1 Tax=Aliarcobacter butzleri TaxID=28197 RepID=UPI003AF3FBE0